MTTQERSSPTVSRARLLSYGLPHLPLCASIIFETSQRPNVTSPVAMGQLESQAAAPTEPDLVRPERNPSWKDLFVFVSWRQNIVLILGLVSALLAGGLKCSLAIFLGVIFDIIAAFGARDATAAKTLVEVSFWCIIICAVGVVSWIINAVFLFSWTTFGELQARCARTRIFQVMLKEDMSWFDAQSEGLPGLLVRIQT